MLVVREPVPDASASAMRMLGWEDLLAEEVGEASKLGSVSRGVIVKLVNGDSMEFHVGRDRKLLCICQLGTRTVGKLTDCTWEE